MHEGRRDLSRAYSGSLHSGSTVQPLRVSIQFSQHNLIEWQTSPDPEQAAESRRVERVLWLDAARQTVVTIDIFGRGAMPALRLYDDLTQALASGEARLLSLDPYAELRRRDEDIAARQRQHRDETWRVIEPLLTQHNAELLLQSDRRGPLIRGYCQLNHASVLQT